MSSPNIDPQRSFEEIRAEFVDATSPHDWLRLEVARFLYPDLGVDDAFLQTLTHLELAQTDLDALAKAQLEPGELLAFEIRLVDGASTRRALFRSLPSPATLLLFCCDVATVDDTVVVRHYFAHREIVEMRTRWPFPFDVAVSLTSPAALDLAEETPPPQRRRPRRRPGGRH